MTLKIRLIPRKSSSNRIFYKTSQIKYSSLSKPIIQRKHSFRLSQKIVQSRSPWQNMNQKQIQLVVNRLDDKAQDLYPVIKQKQQQQKNNIKLKFNKLTIQNKSSINIKRKNKFINKKHLQSTAISTNSKKQNKTFQKYHFEGESQNQNQQQYDQKQRQNRLLKRIRQKRKQYQSQLKNLFKNKRLIIQTDLPLLYKIRSVKQNFPKIQQKKLHLNKFR